MAGHDQQNRCVTLKIPQPLLRRVVANVAIVVFGIFSVISLILSFKVIGALSIFAISCAGVVLFWWLGFPSEKSSSRLEVSREFIRYVPGRVQRRLTEPEFKFALSSQAREIILCHSFFQELPDGVRLIVKTANEAEREFRSDSLDYLTPEEAGQLAAAINAATGLPVRLLKRRRLADGTIQESDWTPRPKGTTIRLGLVLVNATLPSAIGVLTGYIYPATATVVVIGLGVWLFQIAISYSRKRSITLGAAHAAIAFVFSESAYALAYVLTAHFMGHI